MFLSDQANLPPVDAKSRELRMKAKANAEYKLVLGAAEEAKRKKKQNLALPVPPSSQFTGVNTFHSNPTKPLMITGPEASIEHAATVSTETPIQQKAAGQLATFTDTSIPSTKAMLPMRKFALQKPKWHPPWKLYRVISGHVGWVRCLDVEPGNQWFVSGAGDRMIKIWDLASGTLKLSLTGHVSNVRAVKVSPRHPYIFSAGEDKQVKCWDLEQNKVVRHYHGHLSAVYDLALHPTIDILLTSSRDSTVRVWDMRTKANIHTLTGHTNTVAAIATQAAEPQVVSGSHDSTIRLWNLAAGRSMATLTNHKKSVRALAVHPTLYMFASASPDNIKQWKGRNGEFVKNLTGHNSIVNALAVNKEDVLVSGGDNGTLNFWDWTSGYCFQKYQAPVQPGSIDSEAGIFGLCFDHSGSRLLTAEADKTIKCYKEDDTATEDSHPIVWKPEVGTRKKTY